MIIRQDVKIIGPLLAGSPPKELFLKAILLVGTVRQTIDYSHFNIQHSGVRAFGLADDSDGTIFPVVNFSTKVGAVD